MSIPNTLLKASLGFGSISAVGLAALGGLPLPSALAGPGSVPNGPSAPLETTRPTNYPMGGERGQRLGHSHGQNGPTSEAGNCQGQGRGQRGAQRGEHLAAAAAQLGVSEADLRSALGMPDQRPQRPDLAAAAAQLGTTEDELRTSLRSFMQSQRQARQGQGPQAGHPDFTALAQQYGVSEAEFRRIMGIPNRPDLAAAAAQLGVSEADLRSALWSAHGGHRGHGLSASPSPGQPGLGQ